MRISDWSSDVCSADLRQPPQGPVARGRGSPDRGGSCSGQHGDQAQSVGADESRPLQRLLGHRPHIADEIPGEPCQDVAAQPFCGSPSDGEGYELANSNARQEPRDERSKRREQGQKSGKPYHGRNSHPPVRSEEHTSELQSLIRIPYAGFCLQKKKKTTTTQE